MGCLLKEALKTLCGQNQWSYAVFWKIGCLNRSLLIWEECYYEPVPCSALPRISGIGNSDLSYEEWGPCSVSTGKHATNLGVLEADKVCLLVNKMMMDNQINVVGQGLIGRAAFTGNHLWILSELFAPGTHPPEVQNEVCQQISAGIKTLAVIPVLSHGVVQFGSSLTITENTTFINNVKSLILQLECVPGVLLSDNYNLQEPASEICAPFCLRKSVSADSSGNHKFKDRDTFVPESCDQRSIPSQAMEFVGQHSHSISSQIHNNIEDTSTTFQTPKLVRNVVKSFNEFCFPNTLPVMKPSPPFSSQSENGRIGAAVGPSNPVACLHQQPSLYEPGCGSDGKPFVDRPSANCSNIRSVKEPALSSAVLRKHTIDNLVTSTGSVRPQMRTTRGFNSSEANSHHGSILHPPFMPTAHRLSNANISYTNLATSGQNTDSCKMEFSTSYLIDRWTSNHTASGSSEFRHFIENQNCSPVQEYQGKKILHCDIPLAHLDKHKTLTESISGFHHDRQKCEQGYQGPRSATTNYEVECVQPSSGDDLLDVIGVDFKKKIVSGSWNNFIDSRTKSDVHKYSESNSTSMNPLEAESDLCMGNGGNLDSGIFSMTCGDSLLDAVVNRVHKPSPEDSESCRTNLTKTSSHSVPNASSSCGQVSVVDQMQGVFCKNPNSQSQSRVLGSSSSKSKCNKEEAGNYSQISAISGSQMSPWFEQGHVMKDNSSISTAYSKRRDEVSKSNRKRLKPGENPRPRPKDRQMIQDRIKELREIVPNGAKCSIDALLERTIKHMLFMQSVTKHADKLKEMEETKIISKDGEILLKDKFEGGRTWAYEVCSQSLVCPIIVEDLNAPRQMLVEMLCEEHGFFLEIADTIRRLGLTILKGLMETQNDKIWARFAVEADGDVTRMEIFFSLVHLLEQTIKSSASSGIAIENDKMMADQSFHQATSILATGMPHGFQ